MKAANPSQHVIEQPHTHTHTHTHTHCSDCRDTNRYTSHFPLIYICTQAYVGNRHIYGFVKTEQKGGGGAGGFLHIDRKKSAKIEIH